MILDYLSQLPPWAFNLVWSVFVIGLTWLIGQLLSTTICRALERWAEKTPWKWDELVIGDLRRGLPVFSFLVGVYVAVGFWALPEPNYLAVTRTLFTLICFHVTFALARLAGRLVTLYGSQFQQAVPVTSLTQNIARLTIILLGSMMILHGLGVSIAPLLTALGVGGLAVALALQDTLSNLFAGFYLTVARQIRLGDYVKLDSGQEGYVEDIGWRATMIRMLPNNMVIVPNNKLSQAIIINYHLPARDMAFGVDVGVSYDSDLEKVERVTLEVAKDVMKTVQGGVPDAEPGVKFHTFADSSINFSVGLKCKEFTDQYLLKHEFIKRLTARYRKEGIEIPYPTHVEIEKTHKA